MSFINIVFYNVPDLTLYIRIVRRTDQAVLDTSINDFSASPSAIVWDDTVISVEENSEVSLGLYFAEVTFPSGTHICDVVILNDSTVDSIPIEGFELIVDGTTGTEITSKNVKVASDGLDNISVTEPSGRASNFREMMIQLFMRFFNKSTRSATQIKTYDTDGVSVTTQEYTDLAETVTVNKTT